MTHMKNNPSGLPYPNGTWVAIARQLPPTSTTKVRRRPRLDNDEAAFQRFLLTLWENKAIPYQRSKKGVPGKHVAGKVTRTLVASRVSEWARCCTLHAVWQTYLAQLPVPAIETWLLRYARIFGPDSSGRKNDFWIVDLARLLVLHAETRRVPTPPGIPVYARRWPS